MIDLSIRVVLQSLKGDYMNSLNRGTLITIIGAICWGFSGACAQFLFSNYLISPITLTIYRMFFGGFFLVGFSFMKDSKKTIDIIVKRKSLLQLLYFTTLGLIPSQLFYLIATDYSNAATATVLQYTGPAIILVYVCFKYKRMPKKSEFFALIMVMSGVFLLATHANINSLAISKQALMFGVLSAFGFFFYSILPFNLLKEYGSMITTGYGLLLGSIILFIILRPEISLDFDFNAYIALFAMIVVGTIIAYSFYLYGNMIIGPERASIFACLEPVTATVLSIIWLQTMFSSFDVFGIILIIIAVIIL
jgi:drug/metabolite transporter (DMT)-like permease